MKEMEPPSLLSVVDPMVVLNQFVSSVCGNSDAATKLLWGLWLRNVQGEMPSRTFYCAW